MRGQAPLIAMRRQGMRPVLARFELDPMRWRDWANWQDWTDVPLIEIEPADSIRRLDLRCIVGMPVLVCGTSRERLLAMVEALKAAGAGRVIAMQDGAADPLRIDTAEVQ